jgi:hypothetical protein
METSEMTIEMAYQYGPGIDADDDPEFPFDMQKMEIDAIMYDIAFPPKKG